MIKKIFFRLFLAIMFLSFNPANAATLQIDLNGILYGANGVLVEGKYYDVTFQDNSCDGLFGSPCYGLTPYDFSTFSSAQSASQALLDQVFLNQVLGAFDTNPGLTKGCTYFASCGVFTPYGFNVFSISVNYVAVRNDNQEYADSVYGNSISPGLDTSFYDFWTYARWTPVRAIPEPNTLFLVVFGTIALFARCRSVRKTSSS